MSVIPFLRTHFTMKKQTFLCFINLYHSMKKTDVTLLIADETPLSNITYFACVPLTHVALCITKEGKKLYISPLDAGKKFNIPSQILVTPLLNILKPLKPKTFGIDFEQTSVRRMGKLKGTFRRRSEEHTSELQSQFHR